MTLIGRTFTERLWSSQRQRVIVSEPERDANGEWFVWTEVQYRSGKQRRFRRIFPLHDLPDPLSFEAFDLVKDTK